MHSGALFIPAQDDNDRNHKKCQYINRVKETYPNLVVMGGVSRYEPLTSYSIYDICNETLRVIDETGANGRLIIASTNSIHSGVRPENYLAMQYVRRHTPVSYKQP